MLVVGAGLVALSTIVLGTPDPPSWTKLVGTVLGCGGLAVVALALIGGGLRGIGAARDRRIADRDAAWRAETRSRVRPKRERRPSQRPGRRERLAKSRRR